MRYESLRVVQEQVVGTGLYPEVFTPSRVEGEAPSAVSEPPFHLAAQTRSTLPRAGEFCVPADFRRQAEGS